MQEHHSILHGPVNAAWDWFLAVTGLDARWGAVEVPDHVAMSLFVVTLLLAVAAMASVGDGAMRPTRAASFMT